MRDKTLDNLQQLQTKAINRAGGKLRPVLHQGYHKYKPGDFKMPRDLKQERADAKKNERDNRLDKFNEEMDGVVL